MTPQQIKDNAPDGATHYLDMGKTNYLKFENHEWMVWFDYDITSGWGIANPRVISYNLDKIKPL